MERAADAPPEFAPGTLAMKSRKGSKVENSDVTPGLLARQGALHLVCMVLDRGEMLSESGLRGTPAERAEAHGLADLTLRRLGQIDAALDRYVAKIPKPPGLIPEFPATVSVVRINPENASWISM